MKILTAISPYTGDPYNLGEVVLDASRSLPMETTQEILHVQDLTSLSEYDGAIFQVESEVELCHSQSVISKLPAKQGIPYLYLMPNSFSFDVDCMGQLFPDQLVLTPVSGDHLACVIQLFLMKIHHGYHIQGMEQREINGAENRDKKKIWLSVKRGVYQSLETDRIKWIEASDHYVKIFTDTEEYVMIKASLKEFYDKHLSQYEDFYVLNRSLIINTSKVSKIENGNLFIDTDKPLSIPRTRREEVLEVLDVG